MKRLRKYGRPALVLFAIWTSVGLSFAVATFIALSAENRSESLAMILANSMGRVYLWGALSPLIYLAAKRFVIDPRRITARPIVLNLLIGLGLSFFYPTVFVLVGWLTDPNYFSTVTSVWAFVSQRVLMYGWYTFISLCVPTFFTIQALLFFRSYKEEESKNAELRAELSNAQLNALKMQLHPHFLFNSLHSISSLTLLDPKRANTMVSLLGDFLRRTLEHSNDQIVSLADELEFLRCYLEIEKTRFEDRLSVEMKVEPRTLDARVPHLIVQPILENAVKHGISPHAGAGHIEIVSSLAPTGELLLRVSNTGSRTNGNGTERTTNGNGVGLNNVRSRLKRIYGDSARLETNDRQDGGYEAEIRLPFSVTEEEGKE